jgi:hypothetical protein
MQETTLKYLQGKIEKEIELFESDEYTKKLLSLIKSDTNKERLEMICSEISYFKRQDEKRAKMTEKEKERHAKEEYKRTKRELRRAGYKNL